MDSAGSSGKALVKEGAQGAAEVATFGPEVCVKIIDNNPGYTIKAFWRHQIADQNGEYVASGSPFATWAITQPATDQLRITEIRSGNETEYTWTEGVGSWTLETKRGNRSQVETKADDNGDEVRTVTVYDLSELPFKILSTVERRSDSSGKLHTVTEGLSSDGQLVTQYGYDGNGKMSHFTRSDGSFEIYKQHIDTAGQFGGGTFDATIRPWQDLAFASNLTIAQGAVTLTKTAQSGAQEERTTIELINGNLMSTSVAVTTNRTMTSASDPWLSYRLPGTVTLPVRRTVTTRTSPGTPYIAEVTTQEFFTQGAPASLAGRPAYRKDADGKVTVYHHYRPGTYDPLLDIFTQGGNGQFRLAYEVTYDGRTNPFGVTMLTGESTRTVTDPQGRVVSKKLLTWAPGNNHNHLAEVTEEKHSFHVTGALERSLRNGSQVYLAEFDANGNIEREFDETRAQTFFGGYDANGRPGSSTRQGFFADGGLNIAAIPERVTGFGYDAEGRTKLEIAGNLMKEMTYDSRGRLTQQVEGVESGGSMTNGRTTTHLEMMSGVNTFRITTLPSGATQVTETYPDGQVKEISGSAQPSQTIQRYVLGGGFTTVPLPGLTSGGFIIEETRTAGEVSAIRMIDGFGRTIADFVLSFTSLQAITGSWRTYTYDAAGRVIQEHLAGELVREVSHNFGGDYVETLYATPNPNQVRSSVSAYSLDGGEWYRVTMTNDGTQREKLTGLNEGESHVVFIDAFNRSTTQSTTASAGVVTTNIYAPNANNPSVTIARGGLVQYVKGPAGDPTTYEYDDLGRQKTTHAPGGVVTTVLFDEKYGQPEKIETTGSTLGELASTTTELTYYPPNSSSPGLVSSRKVDENLTYYSYYSDGSLKATWGADYPQQYEYSGGRLYRLHTYRSVPTGEPTGTGDTTTWQYKYGLLWKKTDAMGQSVTYNYDNKGRLQTRTWARGINTTYGHDLAGQLRTIDYSDNTPDVTFTRDIKGRIASAATTGTFAATQNYVWNLPDRPDETISINDNTFGAGITLQRGGWLDLNEPTFQPTATIEYYGADAADLIMDDTVTFETAGGTLTNANGVTYTRHSPTQQIQTGTYSAIGGGPVLKATRIADGLGRLKRIETGINGGETKAFMEYTYVNGQRQEASTDRGTWHYSYNGRGEVTGGVKKISGNNVPGYAFTYEFDGIGNREHTRTNDITDVYTPNSVNQYEQRTVPAYFQVRGIAKAIPVTPPATPLEPEGVAVKLDGPQSTYTAAAFGPANYFGLALPVPAPGNQNNALWKGITIEAWANNATNEYKVTESRNAFLPKSPEDYDYDADGNLTKDGRWTYQWDGENRLVSMTARTADFPGQTLPSGMEVGKLEFKYDWMGRRMIKLVYGQNGTTLLRWTAFIYDGWQLMGDVERHVSAGANTRVISRTYSWGPDISGQIQVAGGVGGLLSVQIANTDVATSAVTAQTWIPAYDGNGNVISYLNAANGEITQEKEYGPFGECLRPPSSALLRCPIGWSTKYADVETGLVYYGYRYYAPQAGRWVSRDPAEEGGGLNVFAFCENRATETIDALGLVKVEPKKVLIVAGPEINHRKQFDYAQRYGTEGPIIDKVQYVLMLNEPMGNQNQEIFQDLANQAKREYEEKTRKQCCGLSAVTFKYAATAKTAAAALTGEKDAHLVVLLAHGVRMRDGGTHPLFIDHRNPALGFLGRPVPVDDVIPGAVNTGEVVMATCHDAGYSDFTKSRVKLIKPINNPDRNNLNRLKEYIKKRIYDLCPCQ